MRWLLEIVAVIVISGGVAVAWVAVARALRGHRSYELAAATWQAAHYADAGSTRVVVRKIGGRQVLEERVITVIADDDPDYDARFLEAMAAARQRAALLQSEEP